MKEIQQLLKITSSLRKKYEHLDKRFSLDGKLVGDIGEVLVSEKYGIQLYPENTPIHDGEEVSSGRKVQIKASFKNYSYFPFGINRQPDYFLSVNILENGDLEELYNGPGKFIYENYILKNNLKPYKETYYTLSRGVLKANNEQVPKHLKINILK